MNISTKQIKKINKRKEEQEIANALKELEEQDTDNLEQTKELPKDIKEHKGFYIVTGKVTDMASNNFIVNFRGREINAYAAGTMRKHRIKVLVNDIVDVEVRKEDFEQLSNSEQKILGRIKFRHKTVDTNLNKV